MLDGLDLHVAPGESLALVGATGSGKSTVAGLLARLYDPEEGRVVLDGHDLRELRIADVRRAVALVFEETFLFSESVRENILKKHVGSLFTEAEFEAYSSARKERDRLKRRPPRSAEQALCIKENGRDCPPTHVLLRGNPHSPGDEVIPAFPAVLSPPSAAITPTAETSGRRRALAEWLTDSEQGAGALVARVIVNRVWQHHFGSALVASVGDFGVRAELPTHPDLLEWLAQDLVQHGWKLK